MDTQTIKKRWQAELPDFFKKVKTAAITVGGSATAVWVTNQSMSLELHEMVLDVCKYTIAFCAAVGLTAQFTAKNPEKL
jgi:hypothetical protein